MSNFTRYSGYIYPLPQMTDEERFEYLGKVNEEETFDLDADKFMTEQLGDNEYLLWVTSSSYGKESGEFGSCRPCNQQEIYYHAPKFRAILGEIDTAKLKYIDFCYYNSTECTVDYYLGEEEYKPMTLTEAIQHCKDVADSKCDECGKEHAQLADWLQELAEFNDETPITEEWLNEKFWFDTECEYWDFDTDVNPVEIREIRENHLYSIFVPHFNYKINVRTRGQLRCFFSACGFGDSVKQLKA